MTDMGKGTGTGTGGIKDDPGTSRDQWDVFKARILEWIREGERMIFAKHFGLTVAQYDEFFNYLKEQGNLSELVFERRPVGSTSGRTMPGRDTADSVDQIKEREKSTKSGQDPKESKESFNPLILGGGLVDPTAAEADGFDTSHDGLVQKPCEESGISAGFIDQRPCEGSGNSSGFVDQLPINSTPRSQHLSIGIPRNEHLAAIIVSKNTGADENGPMGSIMMDVIGQAAPQALSLGESGNSSGLVDQLAIDSTATSHHPSIGVPRNEQLVVHIDSIEAGADENGPMSSVAIDVIEQAAPAALSFEVSGNSSGLVDQPPKDSTPTSQHLSTNLTDEQLAHLVAIIDSIKADKNWSIDDVMKDVIGQVGAAALSSVLSGSNNAPWVKSVSSTVAVGGITLTFSSIGLRVAHPELARFISKSGALLTTSAIIMLLATALPPAVAWPFALAAILLMAYSIMKS